MLEREWKQLDKSPGVKLYAPNEAAEPTTYNEWKIVSVISCGATMTRTMKAANGSGEEVRDTRFFHFSQLMTKTMLDKWRKENYEVCPHCGKEHVKGETAQDIAARFMGMPGSSQKRRIQGEMVSAGLWQVHRLRRSIQKGQHSYKEMPEMRQVIRGRPAGGGSGEKAQRRETKKMNRKELARVMAARRGKTIQEAEK